MKLITELSESVETRIVEGSNDGKKHYFIEGIFAQADKPNRNGRTYPRQYMENALTKFMKLVEGKRAMGELNHPPTPTVNLDRVSHLIESLKWDGNNVIGRAKILETPMGNIAAKLLEGGVQLGVSTRGLGSLKSLPNGINEVQSDFVLNTVDIVGDPSAPDAWVQGILEGVEYFVDDDGRIQEQAVKRLKNARLTEERKLQEFKLFLDSIVSSSD